MADEPIELFAFDREVKRAAERLEKQRQMLAAGEIERARNFEPFDVRAVASKASYDAIAALKPSALDVPLQKGLLRWVHELLQARVGADLVLDDAEAITEVHPPRDAEAADTYEKAIRGVLGAANDARAADALARAGELADPVAAVRKERKIRRFEAARRLGLAHPWSLASDQSLGGLARAFLDASEGFSEELLKVHRKSLEGPWRASSAMQLALGHGAKQGWPAHLGTRWLDESFAPLAPRGVPIAPPPAPIGSATFLRAAMAWGFAFRVLSAPRSLPFALARDPYPASAYRFGYLFAAVVAEPAFQRRVLALPAKTATAQARVLRTTLFLYARVLAARTVLAAEETTSASLFEEMTARVFGAPLPESMRDAWPEPRPSEPAQLLGLFGARPFARSLVERYDEDWFANPKAGQHLLGLAVGPAFDAEIDRAPEDEPQKLARAFEEALG